MANNPQSSNSQFRPATLNQQGQAFISVGSQQFRQPFQNQVQPFSQPMQQLPPRPSLQTTQISVIQQTNSSLNNHMSGLNGLGIPLSSAYSFAPSAMNVNQPSLFQSVSHMHAPVIPLVGQPWLSSGGQSTALVTPLQQAGQKYTSTESIVPT